MKNQLTFKLIDGVFDLEDAAEVLRTLIRTKINHHKTQQFSLEERFGADHLNSPVRIKQLRQSLEQLEDFLAQADLKGQKLQINSEVAITANVAQKELVR